MSEAQDWNQKVIEEFRANEGKVGGPFEGGALLLLHTTGAKSGKQRINPVMYRDLDDGRVAVFASKAGAETHPDWYHNLVGHSEVTAEIGTDTREFIARTATGDERTSIWNAQKAAAPGFADYEAKTTREIPVVILDPA
ncbi:MAG TPA: nitroreductase family deazaflavin-dependent oxidoreductase [Acidimicrobiales bacterium]|nr:nitroreductase family deazaflavin-dependent oxidoreductase [Acidimicrobiales bacterium]